MIDRIAPTSFPIMKCRFNLVFHFTSKWIVFSAGYFFADCSK
jgi:hypothetical protein